MEMINRDGKTAFKNAFGYDASQETDVGEVENAIVNATRFSEDDVEALRDAGLNTLADEITGVINLHAARDYAEQASQS